MNLIPQMGFLFFRYVSKHANKKISLCSFQTNIIFVSISKKNEWQ